MTRPAEPRASIAVVGMGAVGTTACIQLIEALLARPGAPAVVIRTFEKSRSIGAGLAYSTEHDFHVLNMRAKTMSLYREAPDDFTDWLRGTGDAINRDEYVPRRLFGAYLRQRFAEARARAGARIEIVHHEGEVSDAHDLGDRVVLATSRGRLDFDQVILCPGHLPQRADLGDAYQQSPHYLPSPWEPQRYRAIPRDATVGILGSSLTAVDVLLTLGNSDFRGAMHCFSRKRSLPKVQGPYVRYPLRHITHARLRELTAGFSRKLTLCEVQALFAEELARAGTHGQLGLVADEPLAHTLARDIHAAERGRTLWYSALDATGTIIPHIWRHMEPAAKAHFLAEHESIWTMFRHCMPAANARQLLELARAERLRVFTGLRAVSYADGRFELTVREGGETIRRSVDYLINATGTTFSLDRIDSPLLANMQARGQLVANPLGGVEVDFSTSRLLYRDGGVSRRLSDRLSQRLSFVGPLTKGVHFYTNSFEMNRDNAARAIDHVVGALAPAVAGVRQERAHP